MRRARDVYDHTEVSIDLEYRGCGRFPDGRNVTIDMEVIAEVHDEGIARQTPFVPLVYPQESVEVLLQRDTVMLGSSCRPQQFGDGGNDLIKVDLRRGAAVPIEVLRHVVDSMLLLDVDERPLGDAAVPRRVDPTAAGWASRPRLEIRRQILETRSALVPVLLVVVGEMNRPVERLEREDMSAFEGDEASRGVFGNDVGQGGLHDVIDDIAELVFRGAEGAELLVAWLAAD